MPSWNCTRLCQAEKGGCWQGFSYSELHYIGATIRNTGSRTWALIQYSVFLQEEYSVFLEEELVTNGWITKVWFLIWRLLCYELVYIQNWPTKFMRTENSWEKTVLHDFECFPPFPWLRIKFEWKTLAFLLVEVARNWKHKDMQNENKLAKSFEAKNNLVWRAQVLTKGSGSGAGKYLIWYGLNLSIDTVFWSFTIWAL